MKSRIIYPQLWLDSDFCQCSVQAQALAMFLVTNPYLKLSRYSRISDRQILFHVNFTEKILASAKAELSKIKWFYFVGEWVYHNHSIAYVDYAGRDYVANSKEEEIADVPEEVKRVVKGLLTGSEPVLNNKQEIINKKLRGESAERGESAAQSYSSISDLGEEDFQAIADQYGVPVSFVKSKYDDMANWLEAKGKRYKNYLSALRNWVKKDALELKKGAGRGKVAFYPGAR